MPAPLASATLPPVITVDGPSGVGKGLVTRWLAAFTGFHLLDSGALYRILALAAQDRGVALSDLDAVAAIAADLRIEFLGTSEADEQILVDGADLTRRVRTEATGALASQIATAPVVRAALLARQRGVLVVREQGGQRSKLDLDEPAGAERVAVEQLRCRNGSIV